VDLSKIVDAIRLSPRYLVGRALATGLLVLLPDRSAEVLGLRWFRDAYRPWLGAAFLISSCLLAGHAITSFASWSREWINIHLMVRRGHARLRELTPAEREVLAGYLLENSRTQYLSISDGIVKELEASRIIRRAASLGTMPALFAYNLQPWAWRYLIKHPELVGLTAGDIGSRSE